MTTPPFGVEHAFGRVEAMLDRIDTKLDGHGKDLAKHEVRLDGVEKDVKELQDHRLDSQQYGRTWRGSASLAAMTVLGSGAVTVAVNLLFNK